MVERVVIVNHGSHSDGIGLNAFTTGTPFFYKFT